MIDHRGRGVDTPTPPERERQSIPAPSVLVENIPEALKTGKRFVAWRFETRKGQPKPAKMPYTDLAVKGASSTAPADWITFDRALAYAEVAGLDGIGRVFVAEDGMVGIDLDNCRNPETGELTPEAAERVKRADTYTEVSPSRTGVKMWMYATMPAFGHKKGDVEIYGSVAGKTGPCGRFFTMTGQHLEGTPRTVGYRPDFVLALHREVFGAAPDLTTPPDDPDHPVPALQLGDEDVIRLASDSQHNGERFRSLWSGDTSGYAVDGNDGASEADGALCELLAYYGGPDRARIERLWLRSDLGSREKVQRADYRKRTIDLALRGKTRFHGDSVQAPTPAPIGTDGASVCVCPACPAVDRVRFLERRAMDRDDEMESLRACNGTLSRKLTRIETERSLDRRMELDKQRIRRVLKPGQAEPLIALAIIGPAMANSAGVQAPFVTREAVAKVAGGKPATVGSNLHILDLPGSPVKRKTAGMGAKSLTAFDFARMDSPDTLTAFADWVETMEEAPKLSPRRPRCDRCAPGTTQTSVILCDGCQKVLARKHMSAPNVQENTTLDRTPTPVSGGSYRAGKHHVGPVPHDGVHSRDARHFSGRLPASRNGEGAGDGHHDHLLLDGAAYGDGPPAGDHVDAEAVAPLLTMAPLSIRPPGMTDEQMCQEHGLPRLVSDRQGRCSMCKTPPSAPVAPAPRFKRQGAPPRPQERPERCPSPGCRALEFRRHSDGSWRCLRSGHDPSAYELAAVAGGSE